MLVRTFKIMGHYCNKLSLVNRIKTICRFGFKFSKMFTSESMREKGSNEQTKLKS